MRNKLFQTTFSKVFFGITITATIALSITEILNYHQLKQGFSRFATKQVTVFQRIGQDILITEDTKMPADYQDFVQAYQNEMTQQVIFSFGLGILLSLVAGGLISRQITRPISLLKSTIQGVTQTGYKIRAPENGSKEVRDLIASFNGLIQELEDQEQLRQELFADISHELKTPITKIRGQVEGILDGVYQYDPKTLTKILGNISQLEYLIQALYEVNQLTPQDVRLKPQKINIKDLVDEAISGINNDNIRFEVSIPSRLTKTADRHRFKQIIDNLINNAVKFTPKGIISISATKEHLSVKDTGIGIGKEHLPHIFERMYRVEKSRNKATGGLGLGLYIVKKLVDMHGWTISAKSDIGQGTTFVIDWA